MSIYSQFYLNSQYSNTGYDWSHTKWAGEYIQPSLPQQSIQQHRVLLESHEVGRSVYTAIFTLTLNTATQGIIGVTRSGQVSIYSHLYLNTQYSNTGYYWSHTKWAGEYIQPSLPQHSIQQHRVLLESHEVGR